MSHGSLEEVCAELESRVAEMQSHPKLTGPQVMGVLIEILLIIFRYLSPSVFAISAPFSADSVFGVR